MKIALCQINPTVGSIKSNKEKILDWYRKSLDSEVDLVVFPELSLIGYPPQDLLFRENFIENSKNALIDIANQASTPIIIGSVLREKNKIYNCAFLCEDGKIKNYYKKILLPTYDVFDEGRYFEKGTKPSVFNLTVDGQKTKVGIQICEDLWDDQHSFNIAKEIKEKGANLIINISASPFGLQRLEERANLILKKVSETQIPFLYCNLVGAQDELIFDGQSLAFNEDGKVLSQGSDCEEDLIIVDLGSKNFTNLKIHSKEKSLYNALVLGVRDYFRKTDHSKAVIGLSGGIDSSLTACIASDALGCANIHGVSMPSVFSSQHSKDDAEQLAKNLNINYKSIPINSIVDSFNGSLAPFFIGTPEGIAEENIQARIRGSLLMSLSNKFNWLVLSTGNKTELAMGYCTLYGDMNGGLAVISDLSKEYVYLLSKWINKVAGYDRIPINTVNKKPSAELRLDQVDPFDYDIVSPLIDKLIDEEKSPSQIINEGYDSSLVRDISKLIRINEYKRRQSAPGLRVTRKAFGAGRRVPIVNKYDELNYD